MGRFVLDSNTEFTATMQTVVDNQPAGFERRFNDDFLAWIATHDSTYHYGTTSAHARQRWEARRASLPTPISANVTLHPADLDNITAGLLFHKNDLPLLAQALSILERLDHATDDERQLVEALFASPVASPEVLAMYLAITCNDTPWTAIPATGCTTPPSWASDTRCRATTRCSSRASTGHTGSPLPCQLPAPRHPPS